MAGQGGYMPRVLKVNLERLARKGYTYASVWLLPPGEAIPPETYAQSIGKDGWKVAWRLEAKDERIQTVA